MSEQTKPVIGAVNWDCSLPSDTFFGFHATKSLSPAKYRYTTPYYADVLAENKIDYSIRTVEEYETEMQYALDAGIDYFAYCWYGDDPEKHIAPDETMASTVDNTVWELTYARKLHLQSTLKNQLKLCAIIVQSHPQTDEELASLANEMKQPHYQCVDGRPLLYLFGGYFPEMIAHIRAVCTQNGAADPYVVFMNNGAESANGDYSAAQAVSAYACCQSNISDYAQLADKMIADNENRKKYGIPIVPHFTVGWNPSPRLDNPVPWCDYPNEPYAAYASEEELLRGADRLSEWIAQNRELCPTGHILTFAWNEFEEGAHICPIYREGNSPNTERLQAFAKIVRRWKGGFAE